MCEQDKSNEMSFLQAQKHEKCYCCGLGKHMLNNCYIKDTIARNHWFTVKEICKFITKN